jgi:hypothetical protein
MEDAVRPNEQAFKAMYERGYRTWFSLYEMTIAETKSHLPWWDCLFQLENAFLDHPSFPENLAVDAPFSNTVIVTGKSTWKTAQVACDLTSFDQEFFYPSRVRSSYHSRYLGSASVYIRVPAKRQ